jgi:plasmid stabilization system protein ParE
MAYKILINNIVLNDVEEAYQWYEEKQAQTGKKFVLELQNVLALIKVAPELFIEIKPKIRRALFQNFPYNLYFKVESEEIVVLGIMHQKRNPSLAKKRLK